MLLLLLLFLIIKGVYETHKKNCACPLVDELAQVLANNLHAAKVKQVHRSTCSRSCLNGALLYSSKKICSRVIP
jgi:hypothetical protein